MIPTVHRLWHELRVVGATLFRTSTTSHSERRNVPSLLLVSRWNGAVLCGGATDFGVILRGRFQRDSSCVTLVSHWREASVVVVPWTFVDSLCGLASERTLLQRFWGRVLNQYEIASISLAP